MLTALASLAMIAAYFLPVWFIFLIAPQYPEGLTMKIWLTRLSGEVDIINGLNHYIGMKHIKEEMFPEFGYLVYIVGFYMLAGLVVAVTGRRTLLTAYIILLFAGAAAAMYDFWSWGYDYGHNLDPKAAIQVPGLYYQPPLLGHKTLLNFDAYSYPDSGGWVIIGAGALFIGVWVYEWYRARKTAKVRQPIRARGVVALTAVLLVSLSSCTSGPQAIAFGQDPCDDCRMTIMEPQFAAEVLTKKGRAYKFDDLHCLKNFLKKGTVAPADIAQAFCIDFNDKKTFLPVETTSYVVSEQIKSPMNGHTAAFATQAAAEQSAKAVDGRLMTWNELMKP